MAYREVRVPPDATIGEDGSSEGAHFTPPIVQINRIDARSGRLVPRANETMDQFLDAVFVDGLRASYRRRLILTLDETLGFRDLMEKLASGVLDEEIAEVMIATLFGIVKLAVMKIDADIEREHAERESRRWKVDPKTGLLNQTAFDEYAPLLFDKLVQERRIVSYIVFDIDSFREVNRHGHPAGDHVLGEIGKIILAQLRSNDTAARDGGDEFAIMLPDTSLREAVLFAERIRKAVESHEFDYKGKKFKITLSVGVGMRQEEDTFNDLHARTDNLERISKSSGGNLISVFLPESADVSGFPDFVNIVTLAKRLN